MNWDTSKRNKKGEVIIAGYLAGWFIPSQIFFINRITSTKFQKTQLHEF